MKRKVDIRDKNNDNLWLQMEFVHEHPHHIVCFRLPGKKVFSHFARNRKEAFEWELKMRDEMEIPFCVGR